MTATLPSRFPIMPSLQSNCCCPLSTRQDRIEICDHDSSVELDQVLKDQLTPAIFARLHKQSTFRKPAKFDRRETEIFRKRTNLRCCAVIVAMTLQRPSLPSSRGPTRRAHPKPTSWRQAGLPRCLRWACLHAAAARRACQGWPRLRGHPEGLGLDWPEHGGMMIGSGCRPHHVRKIQTDGFG